MFRKKVFAYENSQGDKGIIIATSYKKAEQIYRKEYPKRKIVSLDTDDYEDNGAYLFEVKNVRNNTLYNTFPW